MSKATGLNDIQFQHPTAFQQKMRDFAHGLKRTSFNRTLASILLRLAGGKSGTAFDVTIFETQKARLHPFDNISEKRIYITPQFWDPEERAFLADVIKNHTEDTLYFLDVGANAGMYSLFTLSVAQEIQKTTSIIAVEPDPVMRGRMQHNIDASGAGDATIILPWAITAEASEVTLHLNIESRGQNKLGDAKEGEHTEAITVEGHPLIDVFEQKNWPRVDIMKMDIEGHEFTALTTFFHSATPSQHPHYILMETAHDGAEESALQLCLNNGYIIALQNPQNTILKKQA